MPAAPIAPADDRLVWIDLEMTGLKPDADRILEVALVVTDASLAVVGTPERATARCCSSSTSTANQGGVWSSFSSPVRTLSRASATTTPA